MRGWLRSRPEIPFMLQVSEQANGSSSKALTCCRYEVPADGRLEAGTKLLSEDLLSRLEPGGGALSVLRSSGAMSRSSPLLRGGGWE